MVNEMIERVAFTLFRHWRDAKESESVSREAWASFDDGVKATWFRSARAAIEAMREPTEKMLADADSAIPRAEPDDDGFRMMGREVALEAWQAMISAALNENGEGE